MSTFSATIRKLIRSPKPTYQPLTPSSSWRDAFHQWAVVEVASDMPSTPPTLQFVHWPANQDAPVSVASPTPTCTEDFTILTSAFGNVDESSEDWSSIRSVSVYSENIEFSSVASSTPKQATVDFPAICDDVSSVDNQVCSHFVPAAKCMITYSRSSFSPLPQRFSLEILLDSSPSTPPSSLLCDAVLFATSQT